MSIESLAIEFSVLMLCAIPLHELGHYLIAKRIGWTNLKLCLLTWHHIPYAVAVKCEHELTINNEEDFRKAYSQISRVYAMGSLFSIMSLILFNMAGFIDKDFALFAVMYFAAYMVWETTKLPVKVDAKEGAV